MADVVGMGKSKRVKKVIEQKEKDWMMEMLEKVKVEMKDVMMGVVDTSENISLKPLLGANTSPSHTPSTPHQLLCSSSSCWMNTSIHQ